MDIKSVKEWANQAFAQIIIAAVMAFMVVAILIVVMLPVLNGIIVATPMPVGAVLNTTQTTLVNTIGSSLGLLIITLLLIAVLAIIIIIGLFQYFVGGMGGGRQ